MNLKLLTILTLTTAALTACIHPCTSSHNSFRAGTKVLIKDGWKSIDEIKKGDMVYTGTRKNSSTLGKVNAVSKRDVPEYYKIKLPNETINATAGHPFRVDGKGWCEAKKLAAGYKLVARDGSTVEIVSVTKKIEAVTVYNLAVEGNDAFYVGTAGILVGE